MLPGANDTWLFSYQSVTIIYWNNVYYMYVFNQTINLKWICTEWMRWTAHTLGLIKLLLRATKHIPAFVHASVLVVNLHKLCIWNVSALLQHTYVNLCTSVTALKLFFFFFNWSADNKLQMFPKLFSQINSLDMWPIQLIGQMIHIKHSHITFHRGHVHMTTVHRNEAQICSQLHLLFVCYNLAWS